MLRGEFPDAGEQSPEALLAAYGRKLSAAVEQVGVEGAAAETGLDHEVVTAVLDGEAASVTLEEAAALLALTDDAPADVIAAEARDILLMGMTTAVLDVESLAARVDGDLDPKEIQQKVEGRHPITLAEYAQLHHAIEASS